MRWYTLLCSVAIVIAAQSQLQAQTRPGFGITAQDLLNQINFARQNPKVFGAMLTDYYNKNSTKDWAVMYRFAGEEMSKLPPVPPLSMDPNLNQRANQLLGQVKPNTYFSLSDLSSKPEFYFSPGGGPAASVAAANFFFAIDQYRTVLMMNAGANTIGLDTKPGTWTVVLSADVVQALSRLPYVGVYHAAKDLRVSDPRASHTLRGPQLVVVPARDHSKLFVASSCGKRIFIDSYQSGASMATRLATVDSLGLLGGFTLDDEGNFYVLTGTSSDSWTRADVAQPPRPGILHLVKITSAGTQVVWRKDLNSSEFLLSNGAAIYDPIEGAGGRLTHVGSVIFGSFVRKLHNANQASATFAVSKDGAPLLKVGTVTGHTFDIHTLHDERINSLVSLELNDHQPTLSLRRMATPTIALVLDNNQYNAAVKNKLRIVYSRSTDYPEYNRTLTVAGGVAKGTNGGYLVLFSSHSFPSRNGSGFRTTPYNLAAVHVAKEFDTPPMNIDGFILGHVAGGPDKDYAALIKFRFDDKIVNSLGNQGNTQGVAWLTHYQRGNEPWFVSVERPKVVGFTDTNFLALYEENKVTKQPNGTVELEYLSTQALPLSLRPNGDHVEIHSHQLLPLHGKPRLHWNDDPVLWNGRATWASADLTTLYIHSIGPNGNDYQVQAVTPQ